MGAANLIALIANVCWPLKFHSSSLNMWVSSIWTMSCFSSKFLSHSLLRKSGFIVWKKNHIERITESPSDVKYDNDNLFDAPSSSFQPALLGHPNFSIIKIKELLSESNKNQGRPKFNMLMLMYDFTRKTWGLKDYKQVKNKHLLHQ